MIGVWISGVGVLGPGLAGWDDARPVLCGERPCTASDIVLDAPEVLNERERRRSSPAVRLALNVAREAQLRSGAAPGALAAVFGSANSDGQTLHRLLESLVDPEGMVSPTQFHNSVHNAAMGYWSIGTGSGLPGTSIAAHDFTFAATLLKGVLQVRSARHPVLVTVFDMPFPEPLNSVCPISDPFAVALVLTATPTGASIAELTLDWRAGDGGAVTEPLSRALHPLWRGNPAARAVPLLEALARGGDADIDIRYPDDGILRLNLTGCGENA